MGRTTVGDRRETVRSTPLPGTWRGDLRATDAALRAAGTKERAENEKRYLKSTLTFYGADVPAIRRQAGRLGRLHPGATRRELALVSRYLFSEPIHERWTLAVVLLSHYSRRPDRRDLPLVEQLIRRGAWWDLVDWLAVHVAGTILRSEPASAPVIRRWAKDADMWVRRAALLAPLEGLATGELRFSLFSDMASPMLKEQEFFIRKAIGWVLREVGKREPEVVAAYLARHLSELAPLTFREAVRHLPRTQRLPLEARFHAPARRATPPSA